MSFCSPVDLYGSITAKVLNFFSDSDQAQAELQAVVTLPATRWPVIVDKTAIGTRLGAVPTYTRSIGDITDRAEAD